MVKSRIAVLLFLLLASALLMAAVRPAAYMSARAAALRVEASPETSESEGLDNSGSCGGTARFEHVFSTASHCFAVADPTSVEGERTVPPVVGNKIYIDGKERTILEWVTDHNDHVLVRVDGPAFRYPAPFATAPLPAIGTEIFVWGAPQGINNIMLRRGIVGGGDGKADDIVPGGVLVRWLDLTGGHGDSGAGVFDMAGQVVGVVSWGSDHYHFMGIFPLNFTPEQLREIRQ